MHLSRQVRITLAVKPSARSRPGFDAAASMAILEARMAAISLGTVLISNSSPPHDGSAHESPTEARVHLPYAISVDAANVVVRCTFTLPPVLPIITLPGTVWAVSVPALRMGGADVQGLPLSVEVIGTATTAVHSPQTLDVNVDGNYISLAVAGDGMVYVPQHKLVYVFGSDGTPQPTLDIEAMHGLTHVYVVAVDDERATLLLGSSSNTTQLLCVRRSLGNAVVWSTEPGPDFRTYSLAVVPGRDRCIIASYGASHVIRTLRASDGLQLSTIDVSIV
jgi:hypothetical protein